MGNPNSTSMNIIKSLNAENDKIKIFQNQSKAEFWSGYLPGKEFYIAGDSWYRRTEDGIEKIVKPTASYIIPMFCPDCKGPIRSNDDKKAFMREQHCFLCHIHQKTEREHLAAQEKFEKETREKEAK